MRDKPRTTAEARAQAVLELPATLANDIHWSINNFGARIAFGEQSIMEGAPSTFRTAVFVPWAVLDALMPALAKSIEEQRAKFAATQPKAN